jgi:hypothetical protein
MYVRQRKKQQNEEEWKLKNAHGMLVGKPDSE